VAALLAVEKGKIPEATRCEDPDPVLHLGRPEGWDVPRDGIILKCTNGFAGQNGAIVLRAVPA
jgi:hypothetical protein